MKGVNVRLEPRIHLISWQLFDTYLLVARSAPYCHSINVDGFLYFGFTFDVQAEAGHRVRIDATATRVATIASSRAAQASRTASALGEGQDALRGVVRQPRRRRGKAARPLYFHTLHILRIGETMERCSIYTHRMPPQCPMLYSDRNRERGGRGR